MDEFFKDVRYTEDYDCLPARIPKIRIIPEERLIVVGGYRSFSMESV